MAEVIKLRGQQAHQQRGERTTRKQIRQQLSQLPKPETDRRKQLLDQFGIRRPLEIDDSRSVLTIDPGVGATQVDTYATVPAGSQHDGLFMRLDQTDWSSARVEGLGVESQMTVPPRTMAGAFGFWAAQNGPMTLAGKEYAHSELDRQTGEVVLSDRTVDEQGRTVLEQRRLRPSAGTEVSGEMLTSMPPKVGLVGFPEEYVPEPGLLAARPNKKKLQAGTALHVVGKSVERLEAEVTSIVKPGSGWTDPNGAKVEIDTWLRVQNTDRAAIHHESVVLRSGESGKRGYYDDDDDKPSTIHLTNLAKANLKVGPGESQEILVEKQEGRAHVEYRLSDSITARPAGEGSSQAENGADRYMVLDSSKGKRHAGTIKFLDGVDELGSVEVKGASPGSASTTSNRKSSGVTASTKTTWSEVTGAANDKKQTVTQEYSFSNISPVAGQLKLTAEIESFASTKKIKINGRELKDSLDTPQFTAKLESERWGGSKIHITIKIGAGSEATPAKVPLKIEVEGKLPNDD